MVDCKFFAKFCISTHYKCVKIIRNFLESNYEFKAKAFPLQALTGPEGSRRLRLPDFKTIGT
jgi:hypothetical protein